MTFLFLKYLSNCLKNKLNIIFIDETGFSLDNPNLRMWRKDNEQIYGGPKIYRKERINLILAMNKTEIIYGEYYHNETVATKEFKEFLMELVKRIDKEVMKRDLEKKRKYKLARENKHYERFLREVKGITDEKSIKEKFARLEFIRESMNKDVFGELHAGNGISEDEVKEMEEFKEYSDSLYD